MKELVKVTQEIVVEYFDEKSKNKAIESILKGEHRKIQQYGDRSGVWYRLELTDNFSIANPHILNNEK